MVLPGCDDHFVRKENEAVGFRPVHAATREEFIAIGGQVLSGSTERPPSVVVAFLDCAKSANGRYGDY